MATNSVIVQVDGTDSSSNRIGSSFYGTCDTAAATAQKDVTLSDSCVFTDSCLLTGVTIHIKFTYSNTHDTPTLKVGTATAKQIMRYGTTKPGTSATTSWYAGAVVSFTYDGTYWQMNDFKYDTNSNNAVTQTATTTNANYEVLFSATADNTTRTEGARKNSNLKFNPSTGALQANKLQGIDSSGKVRVEFYNDAENRGRFYLYNGSQSSQIEMVGDGAVTIKNSSGTANITLTGSNGNITCTTVNSISIPSGVLQRGTFVNSTTSYSANDMRGMTRFLYVAHGVPHTGTTVSFDSSNNENYSLQLNANYGGSSGNARLSFRTRNGDQSTWSNWLYACPVHRYNTRLEPNTNQTLYVPLEMRNGTAGDCFFLVASNNYGNSGLYFLTPNTAVAHQMVITTLKSSSYLTIAAVSDDWGFKVTAGSAAYYLTLIRLS